MDLRTTRALAAATVLALGACADLPTTAPTVRAPGGGAARSASGPGVTLIPNTVKYRDNGGKPATGRSGAAALRASALLGKDGVTELEYLAIPANSDEWWVTGNITRAQIKGLDADGTVMFAHNDNHLDSQGRWKHFNSLARGQYLQVQASITGIDPHRTDVVTVTERIKLRPDLAVGLEVAPSVPASGHVPVTATVTELNGDVGAYAQCILFVDGVASDWAFGVWIDAGDAVTCAFSHAFPAGIHDVQVGLAHVFPGDWDESNNRSPVVRVEAVAPTGFSYFASATARQWTGEATSTSQWQNQTAGTAGESETVTVDSGTSEMAYISGFIGRGVTGSVSVDLSLASGGRVLYAEAWNAGELGCASRVSGASSLFICSYTYPGWAQTWFTWSHNAGSVTYHGRSYYREWDAGTGEDVYYYHQNTSWESHDGPLAGFGDDFGFHLRVTDAERTLTMDTEFPLVPAQSTWGDSYCGFEIDPWISYSAVVCNTFSRTEQTRSGQKSG